MFNRLLENVKQYKSVILGFSGGVDSSLVAYALKTAGIPFLCVTVQNPLLSSRELAQSDFFCEEYSIERIKVAVNVLECPEVAANSRTRCYFCKAAVFGKLLDIAKEKGYETVMDGTNKDDEKEYRPGLKAKEELGVISPLSDCGFTKADVRKMCKEQGLKIWDKPSSPCIATRIPYDTPLDEKILHAADSAERILLEKGLKVVRVRVHGDIARIEAEDINAAFNALDKETTEKIKRCGFKFVCIDAEGYRKGCFD